MSDLPPDPFWDSDTETWDSDTDTWDALPVVEPPAPEDPPPPDPGTDPGDTGTEARLLQRTLPEAPPVGVYRFLVGDLLGGGITEELPFTRASYSFLRNRPGGFSGSIAKPNAKAVRATLNAGESALYVERDGVIMWGGIILTTDSAGDSVQVGGEGFWSHFRKILHEGKPDPGRPDHNKLTRYNDDDTFLIVRDLIDYAQTYYDDTDLSVLVDEHNSGIVRDAVFRPWERKSIGDAIEKMAEDNPGFDFSLDVGWEGDALVKRLHLFSARGRRTEIVFDDHKNCSLRSRTIDAKDTVRQITATGSGTGGAQRRFTVSDSTLAGQRPYYQEVVSFSDIDSVDLLESRATKLVSRRKAPMETISIEVTPQRDLPIGAWRTGDYVRVRADDDFEPVDDFYRVVGWEVDVDEAGQEVVTLDFGPIPA